MRLDKVQHVPTFTRNLVSGPRLLNDGFETVIRNRNFYISKNGARVATGYIDPKDNLLKLDSKSCVALSSISTDESPVVPKQLDANVAHVRWGHCGESMIQRTASSQNIKITGVLKSCEVCMLSKSNQMKKRRTAEDSCRELLEMTQIDLQGPFPVKATDGTDSNIKLIDSFSGYVTMETIPNKSALTTTAALKRYKTRMELRTGKKKMKIVAVDQGKEFDGQFLQYIAEMGLTKLKGTAYKHHLPPKAERANQTILKWGRAMLLDSQLPTKFYSDAQLTAAYISNRMVHAGQTLCPFEIMYGSKPKLSHLHPFGTVGYVFVSPERRNKLANVRERCRLLGYGDNDNTEEVRGYKVLVESGMRIVWSSDVLFDESVKMTPIQTAPSPASVNDLLEFEDIEAVPNQTVTESANMAEDIEEDEPISEEIQLTIPNTPVTPVPNSRTLRPRTTPDTPGTV